MYVWVCVMSIYVAQLVVQLTTDLQNCVSNLEKRSVLSLQLFAIENYELHLSYHLPKCGQKTTTFDVNELLCFFVMPYIFEMGNR